MTELPINAVLSPANRLVLRLEIANRPGMFAQVARVIGDRGCSLGAILPSMFDKSVVPAVAKAVAAATRAAGLARRMPVSEGD